MTIYAIKDIKTSNILCEDHNDDGALSQILAFRTKGCAEAYYKEILKCDPDYKVCKMNAK